MNLNSYQRKVIQDLENYLDHLKQNNGNMITAFTSYWRESGITGVTYTNHIAKCPHVCFKVPTAGGKTFIAINAIAPLFDFMQSYISDKSKLVLWLVPSLSILQQTAKALKDPSHPYHLHLKSLFNGRINVFERDEVISGAGFNRDSVQDSLNIIVMSFDALKSTNKDNRRAFKENGALASFTEFQDTSDDLNMNRKGDKALIVGLDIGTSKVVALVGEYSPGNPIEVIGIGSHESRGLKRGVVVDIESTVQSIQRAVEEAELMAGCEIRSVYASISGAHVQCKNSPGIVPIRDGEVTWGDLDRVLEAAKAVAIPADQKILHAIPREYVLDDSQEGIRNPVGMTGVRLEVHAHLVVCAQSAAANISKCVQRCGLQIDDLILSSLGSSVAVLTSDERELGVVLVDMGAGTTDLAVFVQGAICHTASLPIAGDHVTNDIAHMLRTPTPEAEQIKVRYACALAQLATAEESIQVPSVGDRPPRRLPRHSLAQAVQGRYEEIFEMVQAELRRSGFEELVRAGMVLTGGASKMEGVVELAEEMLQMPVRIGIPQHVTGLGEVVGNPVHATGVGLLLMGSQIEHPRRPSLPTGKAGTLFNKLKNWYRGEF